MFDVGLTDSFVRRDTIDRSHALLQFTIYDWSQFTVFYLSTKSLKCYQIAKATFCNRTKMQLLVGFVNFWCDPLENGRGTTFTTGLHGIGGCHQHIAPQIPILAVAVQDIFSIRFPGIQGLHSPSQEESDSV